MAKEYTIVVGGAAGEGVKKTGHIIASLFNELGYKIYVYEDYESVIVGGHNFSEVRASESKILSRSPKIDFLLALNEDTLIKHLDDLKKDGIFIYNSDDIKGKRGVAVPIETITKKLGGKPIMKNTALISAFAKVIGLDFKTMKEVLAKEFGKIDEINLKIAETAYSEVENVLTIPKLASKCYPLVTGNEAIAMGALKAGLNLYISYPMTPTTSILHFLALQQKDYNIAVFQPENEIAVINSALGASFAGKRVMVGTSGGGFALMTEAISLAAQAEVPITIVESQRTGPSTGAPTYMGQSDLLFILNSGHGDFLRFVVAPGDSEEAFYLAGLALNISEKYQIPSIILSDKDVSESTFSFDDTVVKKVKIEKPKLFSGKGEYKRYLDTKSGISPLAFPGTKGIVVKGVSYEHDEFGITVEKESEVKKMQEKRLRKYQTLIKEIDSLKTVNVYGKGSTALLTFGSSKGAAIELSEEMNVKVIQLTVLQPFPLKEVQESLKGIKKLVTVEANAMGQLNSLLNQNGIKTQGQILKYTGRPFTKEDIEQGLRNI